MLVEAVRQFNRGGVDSCPSFFGRRDDLLRRKDHSSHAGVSHFQRVRVSNTGHTFRPILARACTYMSFGYFNTRTRNRFRSKMIVCYTIIETSLKSLPQHNYSIQDARTCVFCFFVCCFVEFCFYLTLKRGGLEHCR